MTNFLVSTLILATPLILAAVGSIYSERSGVINMGLEGLILVGAFTSYIVTFYYGSVYLGILAAIAAGFVMGIIQAYFTVTLRADQVVYGITTNIFALGLTSTLYRIIFAKQSTVIQVEVLPKLAIPLLKDIPVLGRVVFNHNILVYLALAMVVITFIIMFKTKWGLKIRAIGDHPRAADTMGISVFRYRYIGLILSGIFASLGGASLIVGGLGYFVENMSAGRGYVALAAIFFGRFNPIGAFLGALLFGATDAFQLRMQAMGFDLPNQLFSMSPYLITLLVLVFLMGPSTTPRSYTIPYIRSGR